MINLLLGAPGGGKSYEAVAYHVIPALAEGRKVITNLPLNLEHFPPEQRRLIELREETKAVRPTVDWQQAESNYKRFGIAAKQKFFSPRAFANVEDYGDSWRHPETGSGPLYVIDECHLVLPRSSTPIPVSEWFSLHRHEFADVLLITQSYGKVCKDIIDLVQVCYRVRKASHLGFSNRYIRKVFDGVRGECMNETTREYEKTYFKFYRSHTRSSSAGKELEAKDIVPIWKHWTFKGAALCALIAVGIIATSDINVLEPKQAKKPQTETKRVVTASPSLPSPPSPSLPPPASSQVRAASASTPETMTAAAVPVAVPSSDVHPLRGYGVHVSGLVKNAGKRLYMFTVSQNGQAIYNMNETEMNQAGYTITARNDCIVEVVFDSLRFFATCDSPRVGVNPGANMPKKS